MEAKRTETEIEHKRGTRQRQQHPTALLRSLPPSPSRQTASPAFARRSAILAEGQREELGESRVNAMADLDRDDDDSGSASSCETTVDRVPLPSHARHRGAPFAAKGGFRELSLRCDYDEDASSLAEEEDGDMTLMLPDECLVLVFRKLGVSDLARCSLVCKRWHT